ncbi:MAG: UDP-N-acetylmuramate dehydrogenase [Lachnoclostridium sp.]|nr:UDP-N-acetylmuramate dehydrogenase [Lachnospira sp.]MCM1248224.1 UDP-N-acetylmuramate dehydrogenase [Lachnoclostridium sp.]MCM1534988.1 UDP-N-acetylmuramate dehydrogenase [Clostridium sp.]
MISGAVIETLKKFVPQENIYLQEPMSLHTTFKVGGNADCLVELETEEQARQVYRYLNMIEVPFFVLGNGSNTLVRDEGYNGVMLRMGQKMSAIDIEGNCMRVQAGALLSQTSKAAMEHGLSGLEFASGIPGTVGGGVIMNAGAYGGEMSQVVTEVTVINKEGEMLLLDNETMEFGYRYSSIRNQPFLVTQVSFKLQQANPLEIQAKMEELTVKRRQKQPLEYPSAGSTFKRPEGYFAGELIMNAGLRGYQIGGARVSDKHCGFVVNMGNATAADVLDVIAEVQERVKERFGVELQPEVVIV